MRGRREGTLHFNGCIYRRLLGHWRPYTKINVHVGMTCDFVSLVRDSTLVSVFLSGEGDTQMLHLGDSQQVCAHRTKAGNNQLDRWKKSFPSIFAEISHFSFKAKHCRIINPALCRKPHRLLSTKRKQHTAKVRWFQKKRKKTQQKQQTNKYNLKGIYMKRSCSVQ